MLPGRTGVDYTTSCHCTRVESKTLTPIDRIMKGQVRAEQ